MSVLLEPLSIGGMILPNRIVMAPVTRCRAGDGQVPTPLTAEYYAQRASAGLIIAEATCISAQGVGYADTPGIWSEEQTLGWRRVTDAVHAAGGRIFLQLWHVGRISDPELLDGELPVAPSAIAAAGRVSRLRPFRPFVTPRPLETDEIPGIVEDFRRGAENAMLAGFDGVEVHAANGYLIDQFLQDSTNKRTDRYGGNIENRARFLFEVTDAVISVWGAARVGIHLRPRGEEHDMGDSDPKATFGYVAEEMGRRGVGFLFIREIEAEDSVLPHMRELYGGPVIANEKLSREDGERLLQSGVADAIAFGRDYISTPDLVERFSVGAPLNQGDPSTYYGGGAAGYTDYPVLTPSYRSSPAR
ncbi:alkene reductase [Rhodococcus sp. T2V]|uniref:alkene reductase n=1 Tax=Rhodococcus sp. T2V TaxID=3034164 RepID=UPI0023E22AC0|nr:alkene reductase [Rhodococcus sp. T2V]MDF3306436.1 alkene reductase [Rhodococcus sp. T2V]